MAKSKRNIIIHGATGKIGDVVIRIVNGVTIISSLPKFSETASPAQLGVRTPFARAIEQAKILLLDPEMEAEYTLIKEKKKLTSAWQVAVGDCRKQTKLLGIQTDFYHGTSGSLIQIQLKDNYKGKEMVVSICNKDGTILESGNATYTFGKTSWNYTTTTTIPSTDGLRFFVTVKDRPGNVVTFEKSI